MQPFLSHARGLSADSTCLQATKFLLLVFESCAQPRPYSVGFAESELLAIFLPLARPKITQKNDVIQSAASKPPRREALLAADLITA